MKLFEKEQIGVYPKEVNLPMAVDGLANSNLFLTSFQGGVDLNYQINYAFNNEAYMYVFGDKLSMFQISGVGFPKESFCATTDASTPTEFIKFYKEYKLGETDTPLRITVGGMILSGYFVGMSINLVTGKQNTYTFSFRFLGRVN